MNEDLKNLLATLPESILVFDDEKNEIIFENIELQRMMKL